MRASPPPSACPPDYRLKPFDLPEPGDRYAIGTRTFVVAQPKGKPLHVVTWYPAEATSAPPAPYLDPAEHRVQAPAIARNLNWPTRALDYIARLPTHARPDVSVAHGRFPLLIFSHGYPMYPRQNTALMEHPAARGYIVLSLAHPGDAADIPTAAGVIATVPPKAPSPADLAKLNCPMISPGGRPRRSSGPGASLRTTPPRACRTST